MHPGILASMVNQPQFRPTTRAAAVSRIFGADTIPPAAAEERYVFHNAGVGLGGLGDVQQDLAKQLEAKLFELRQQLAQAEIERRQCDENTTTIDVFTLGLTKAHCILTRDANVAHFKELIAKEIEVARVEMDKLKGQAADAAAAQSIAQSKASATAGGSGAMKYLPIGAAVLALGFAGYMLLKK